MLRWDIEGLLLSVFDYEGRTGTCDGVVMRYRGALVMGYRGFGMGYGWVLLSGSYRICECVAIRYRGGLGMEYRAVLIGWVIGVWKVLVGIGYGVLVGVGLFAGIGYERLWDIEGFVMGWDIECLLLCISDYQGRIGRCEGVVMRYRGTLVMGCRGVIYQVVLIIRVV